MSLKQYENNLKKRNLYEYLRIRPDSECVIYKPGMDFLKVPTIDPKSYKFPELDKALKNLKKE